MCNTVSMGILYCLSRYVIACSHLHFWVPKSALKLNLVHRTDQPLASSSPGLDSMGAQIHLAWIGHLPLKRPGSSGSQNTGKWCILAKSSLCFSKTVELVIELVSRCVSLHPPEYKRGGTPVSFTSHWSPPKEHCVQSLWSCLELLRSTGGGTK